MSESESHSPDEPLADNDDLRAEYDPQLFKQAVKGKYAKRYREGTNVVILDPDVQAIFPTSEAVNKALRQLIQNPTAN